MSAEHPLLVKLARGSDLSEEEAEAVRAVPVQLVRSKADKVIAREGDRPTRSFQVAEGLTCISEVVAGGRRQIMTLQIPGDASDFHTIQLKFLDSDLWAITDCTLAYMAHADLRRLGRKHPRLMEEMWRWTLVEGSIYREWMVNVAQRQAESRMAHPSAR
jgi:CRP-like cAMP-binding protein